MMDFDKLLEPYGENGRTLHGQIQWLLKNGIPHASIDYAVLAIYKRLECGEKFNSGHELDRELLAVAQKHYEVDLGEQLKKRIAQIAHSIDSEWNTLSKTQKIWEILRGRA